MKQLTCIICPMSCQLAVVENADAFGLPALAISGNRCARGEAYAEEEIRAPKRVVTATCKISEASVSDSPYSPRRAPVKTSAPCPKEKIPELLQDIYRITISLPVKAGDVVLSNWNGSGLDIVATRNLA
jgi:CxxC motif-containing protein